MKEYPNYYAIIPAKVRYSKRISSTAKLMYGEITALSNKDGYCWARNEYFSKLFDISKTRVSLLLKSLETENFIKIEVDKAAGNKRRLYTDLSFLKKTQDDPSLTFVKEGSLTLVKDPIQQKLKSNINTTSLIIQERIHELFDYFCLKTKRKLKFTPERAHIIRTRLKEYSFEDLKKAVDNFILDDWPDRKNYTDIAYCIGVRNKVDNLERWLNRTPRLEKRPKQDILVLISERLGRIAPKKEVVRLLKEIPTSEWFKVGSFLQQRYPSDGRKVYAEAEREVSRECAAG